MEIALGIKKEFEALEIALELEEPSNLESSIKKVKKSNLEKEFESPEIAQ